MSEHNGTHTAAFYIKIWVVLLTALVVSLVLASLGNATLAATLIFGVAAIKAFLVAAYYMGLSTEARYISIMLLCGLILMVILFVGLLPDIVYVYG